MQITMEQLTLKVEELIDGRCEIEDAVLSLDIAHDYAGHLQRMDIEVSLDRSAKEGPIPVGYIAMLQNNRVHRLDT